MIISHKHKFIFFKSLKVAGSSIGHAFSQACDKGDLITGGMTERIDELGFVEKNNLDYNTGHYRFHSHTYPELLYKRTRSAWDDYYKISSVRNPWDLLVSYYWWGIREENKQIRNRKDFLIVENENSKITKEKFELFYLSPGKFDSIISGNSYETECTFDWISRHVGNFLHPDIDYYIKFESLNQDYAQVCDVLKIKKANLEKFKSNTRRFSIPIEEYYTDYMKDLVFNSFHDYIKKFKYSI